MDAPANGVQDRRGERRRTRLVAAVAVIAVLVAGAVGAGLWFAAGNLTAAVPMCRNVALARGLDFRGAYGPTNAIGPMSVVMQRNMGNGAAVGDYDGDGYPDVYLLAQNAQPSRLFRNVAGDGGTRRFTDVTEAAGLGEQKGLSRVAQFVDLDGDGRLDLVVVNDADSAKKLRPSTVYRNKGDGTFQDMTEGSGFLPIGYIVGGLAVADYNLDGRLDLYISYWTSDLAGDPALLGIKGTFPAQNLLFRNEGGFRFTDVTEDAHLGGIHRDSFTAIFTDFDGDRDPDLYVAVDHRADLFYLNNGDGTFRNATEEVGATHVGNDMGVAATDMTGDGSLSLYATNISDPTGYHGSGQGNTFQVVTKGADGTLRFTDHAREMGISDTAWGWGTTFLDINLDGALDLFAAQGMDEFVNVNSPPLRDARSTLFLGDGKGGFAAAKGTGCDVPGDQRTAIAFDYNRDGRPDLLMTQVGYHAILLENGATGAHGLTVNLDRGGVPAIGARVTVSSGGRSQTQLILAGGSYLAGPPLEATFGLGGATSADAVTIRWADGRETKLTNVQAGQVVRPAPDGSVR